MLTGGVLQLTFLSGSEGVLSGGDCTSLSGGGGGGVVPPFLSLSLFSISGIISLCQILRSSSGMRTNLSLSGQVRVLKGVSGILSRAGVSSWVDLVQMDGYPWVHCLFPWLVVDDFRFGVTCAGS